jgi:hypothetical protein
VHVLHPTVRNKEEVFVRPDSALCPEYGFDAPSIEIMWSSDGHPDQRLDYYDGCLNPKVPPEMWVRWCAQFETLPIAGFVGPRNRR